MEETGQNPSQKDDVAQPLHWAFPQTDSPGDIGISRQSIRLRSISVGQYIEDVGFHTLVVRAVAVDTGFLMAIVAQLLNARLRVGDEILARAESGGQTGHRGAVSETGLILVGLNPQSKTEPAEDKIDLVGIGKASDERDVG